MKQGKNFLAVAVSLLIAVVCVISCSNQDNIIATDPTENTDPDDFDKGSLIVNGRLERKEMANFLVHEWRTNDVIFRGIPNVKWDEETPRNHCIIVEARSEEEARNAGNPTLDENGEFDDQDTQFFIILGENQVLEKDDQIRLTMKVKADEEVKGVVTQSHAAAGTKLHWFGVGNLNFTTNWTEFDSDWITVDDQTAWGKAQAGMYTIAFNLAKGIHNRYFFDDIRVDVKRHDK